MNIDVLNRAVQWAIDEYVLVNYPAMLPPPTRRVGHMQELWARGHTTAEVIEVDTYKYRRVECDSGCCLAGNIVFANGDRFVVPGEQALAPGDVVSVDTCIPREGGHVRMIDDRALELLDVKDDGPLFGGDNMIGDIVSFARDLAEEHGETLTVNLYGLDMDDLPFFEED